MHEHESPTFPEVVYAPMLPSRPMDPSGSASKTKERRRESRRSSRRLRAPLANCDRAVLGVRRRRSQIIGNRMLRAKHGTTVASNTFGTSLEGYGLGSRFEGEVDFGGSSRLLPIF